MSWLRSSSLYRTVEEHSGSKALEHFVEDVVEWIDKDRDTLLYMRMALLERSPGSQRIFARLVEILRDFIAVYKQRGFLQEGVDEEWAAMFLVFDFLGPAVIEPFALATFGKSMYERSMIEKRNAFMRRLVTQGFLKS